MADTTIYTFTVRSSVERNQLAVTSANIGQVCKQTIDNTYWILLTVSPVSWGLLANTTSNLMALQGPMGLTGPQGLQGPAGPGSGGTVVSIPYTNSMTPDVASGTFFQIVVTNGLAFTINTPSNPTSNSQITIQIVNRIVTPSNGPTGVITMSGVFALQTLVLPIPYYGDVLSISFGYDGASWFETGRTTMNFTTPRLNEINVVAFGADPSGTRDSQPGFTAASLAFGADTQTVNGTTWGPAGYATVPIGLASGITIFVPRGQYLFNSAWHIGAYTVIKGENSVFIAKDASTDILVVDQIYRQQISGIQFIGGRYQVTGVTGTDDIRFSNCVWARPGAAGIYNTSQTTNRWHFEDCDFLGQFGVTSGSMWLASGATVDGAGGVDTLVMRRCMCLTSQTNPFIFAAGDYRLSQCFFVQGGSNNIWFELYGSNIIITNSKFTGEAGSPDLFELRPLNRPGDGFYPLNASIGNITITDSVIYSRLMKFYVLPEKLTLRNLIGVQNTVYFDSGISQYQIQNSSIQDWEVDFKSGKSPLYFRLFTGGYPTSDTNNTNDILMRLLYRNGHQANTNQKVPSTSFMGYVRLDLFPSDGTAVYASGFNSVFNSVTVNRTTDSLTGRHILEATSTANGANFFTGLYAGQWTTLAGPGHYTLSVPIEIVSTNAIQISLNVGDTRVERELSTGRHVVNIPFSFRTQPKVWTAGGSYVVGDIVYTGGGSYSPGNIGSCLYCISAGTSAGSYAPTGSGTFASPYVDGGVQWIQFFSMQYLLTVPVMTNGDVIRISDARVFKGMYTGNDWRVVAVDTAIPTRGNWQVGDIIENTAPLSGSPLGWICLTSGAIAPAWTTNTSFKAGDLVSANSAIWICTNQDGVAHTSAASGTGPSNSPTAIFPANDLAVAPYFNDNGVRWNYYSSNTPAATFAPYGLIG